jgi:phosphinothricin acetyltransferase
MILRDARVGDAARICEIWNDVIRNSLATFTTEEKTGAGIAADIAQRGPAFIVAELDGRVVGFATYFPFRGGPGYAWTKEHSIQLDPAVRGRGIGAALMTRLEAAARDADVHSLWAGVSGANPAGEAFHARLGYARIARLAQVGFKQGHWLDLVLMQKFLQPGQGDAPDTGTQPG